LAVLVVATARFRYSSAFVMATQYYAVRHQPLVATQRCTAALPTRRTLPNHRCFNGLGLHTTRHRAIHSGTATSTFRCGLRTIPVTTAPAVAGQC
jgi:hypothetical protein